MSTVIDERFEIRRRLGAGGMGEVFEAFDRERNEVVALKTLRYPNPASVYHFKKEFRALQDVSHPNLVSLYELVVDQDQWFFTMELIDGESLKDFVYPMDQTLPITVGSEAEASIPLNDSRLHSALAQLASGVQAIHDAGRLHRDLKPSNILLSRQGRLVILDFGVATELVPLLNLRSVDTSIAGTAAYMAPEQARGEPAQTSSDWYAVGVILFEILTGRWPFTGSLARILIDKQFQPSPSPASLTRDLPADLVELTNALLETEPDDRPTGPEILARLGGGEESGVFARPTSAAQLLVGRTDHLEALEEAFARTQDGHGVAVHVHGPSGIGKTALVHRFLRTLIDGAQAAVLTGRCYEHEMVPYKALDGIVDSLSRYLRSLGKGMLEELLPRRIDALARLFPVLLRVDPVSLQVELLAETGRQTLEIENPDRPHLRRQALRALRQLLERIVTLQPLVLHVDDLQWADSDSVRMLEEILAEPDPPPVLLVTSFRSEELEARAYLQRILARCDGESSRALAVDALGEPEARDYVRQTLGSRPGTDFVVDMVVQEARGVPFFLEQLTRHAMSSRSGMSAGLSLVEMLEERLQQLPRGGEAFLNVLAAAGRPVDGAVAVQAAGYEGDDRRLLAALKTACLVRTGTLDQDVELYHDRIREALLARLGRAEARRVHHRLLAALEARGAEDPEMLLEQARRAGDSKKAAYWARRAAEKASSALAFERAAELYRRAYEIEENPGERFALRDRLADTLACGGRTRDAAELHLELSDASSGLAALQYRRAAAMEYLMSGYVDRGLEVAEDLLEAVGLRLPPSRWRVRAALAWSRWNLRLRGHGFKPRPASRIAPEELLKVDTCWSMATGLAMTDTLQAALYQSRHLRLALAAGEPYRISRAMAFEIGFQATAGKKTRRRAERLYDRTVALAERIDDAYAMALAMLQRGVTAYLNGEWLSALRICDQAEGMFLDCSGVAVWEVLTARRFALAALAFMGELGKVAKRLPTQLEEARERGNVYGTNELRTRLNLYWLALDDPEQAQREIAEASSTWSRRGYHLSHHSILVARVQLLLYQARGGEALAWIEEEWPRLEASDLLRIQATRIEASCLRARAFLGAAAELPAADGRRLARRAEAIARRLEREGLAMGRPLGALVRYGVARLADQEDAARRLLESAAADFETCDMRLHAAAARRRLAELEGEGGDLRAQADAAIVELGARNPAAMTAMLAP